ncbi:MAG TPA: molybdate ABC transporter substrate-binding protein [Dokdonella sp.]|nr:molybdate ABC transporter substrate-binding protein [Dokdonella sp.]HNR90857.1 molybdate ABC transporter substrate-binding protein [Dokdonella sp.]
MSRLVALLACALALSSPRAYAVDVLVFAAASLKPALDSILITPDAQRIGTIRTSYAASSQLARQIQAGAPAAVFISADQDWMDVIDEAGLLTPGTRTNLLGNSLVLVAPDDSDIEVGLVHGVDLAAALGTDGRLAVGEPHSVPAGKYAKAALTALGAWDAVSMRLVAADNVRAALNFVVRREVPLGIVYRSDAVSESGVRVVDTFPASTHAPIVYPVAVLKEHDTPAARALLALLHSAGAKAVFERHGFDVPTR